MTGQEIEERDKKGYCYYSMPVVSIGDEKHPVFAIVRQKYVKGEYISEVVSAQIGPEGEVKGLYKKVI